MAWSTKDGVSVTIISLCKSGHIFFLCPLSPFSCPIYKQRVEIVLSSGGVILVASQSLRIIPAVFVYNMKPHILQHLAKWNVCRLHMLPCVCVLIHRGQAEKRAGGIVSAEVEGWNSFVFAVRKYDLRASCQLP